jgi:hypothetical protein
MDWVEAIGYQHEVLHRAALAHLLRGSRRDDVASHLLRRDVADVRDVGTERKLTSTRPVDLAATVIGLDGTPTPLAIEIKVDSDWTPAQLQALAPAHGEGILLALGHTALAVTDHDMRALGSDCGRWRLVRPLAWGQIVREHADGDRQLQRYARRVLNEAAEHADALAAIAEGRPVTASPDRDAQALAHWAYFHEILRDRADVADWGGTTLRSGALLTLWVTDTGPRSSDYLEFMGEHDRRSLCVKTAAPPRTGELMAARARLRALLSDYDTPVPRRPAAKDKTCTAAKWWLDDVTPEQASALADELRARLEAQPVV